MSAAQVVVLGKSLGGAVALHLAASNPSSFKAIVVENTFLSIEDVAPKASSWVCQATICGMQLQGVLYTVRLQGLLQYSTALSCLPSFALLLLHCLAPKSTAECSVVRRCCRSWGRCLGGARWATS